MASASGASPKEPATGLRAEPGELDLSLRTAIAEVIVPVRGLTHRHEGSLVPGHDGAIAGGDSNLGILLDASPCVVAIEAVDTGPEFRVTPGDRGNRTEFRRSHESLPMVQGIAFRAPGAR